MWDHEPSNNEDCAAVTNHGVFMDFSCNQHLPYICKYTTDFGVSCAAGWLSYQVLRKEGNVLFNDALNTFYLRLYGVRHMVKDHSDSKRGNLLPPHGLLSPINSPTPYNPK